MASQILFYWKARTECLHQSISHNSTNPVSTAVLWVISSAGQPGTIRCHAGLNWCLTRICPASFVFVLHTSTCAHRGWLVFQMYTCALIYTVCLCHMCDHIQWSQIVSMGRKKDFLPEGHIFAMLSQADISSVLVRAVWPGEHRKDRPVGLVEPPTCLWDAQNRIRKAAFLS